MNRKIALLALLVTLWLPHEADAQNAQQAKTLYTQGRYEEALPLLRKLVQQTPANGTYRLWCGVACMQTGQSQEAIRHLEAAVKRRTTSAQYYLGQAYCQAYRCEEAVSTCEEYISELEKRKRSTADAETLLETCKSLQRMMKGVEQVCVVDSFVVDKEHLLETFRLSPEAGKLYTYDSYFGQNGRKGGTVFETELGNKAYYSEMQPDSTLAILSSNKLMDEWSAGTLLPGEINEGVNANYPFVLNDGVTIYYAADGPNSIGGYDIFVTRYNTNTGSYLTPDNIGMPFNSPANDYLYVIDEYLHLGWFASDRFQPEGKVCVYLFIPNSSKQVYNYEAMDRDRLIQLARLTSIRATWQDPQAVEAARQRLHALHSDSSTQNTQGQKEFEFVLNDRLTYTRLSDFRTDEGRQHFRQYCQAELDLLRAEEKLATLRQQYADTTADGKRQLAPAILDLEKRIPALRQSADAAARQVRQAELSHP